MLTVPSLRAPVLLWSPSALCAALTAPLPRCPSPCTPRCAQTLPGQDRLSLRGQWHLYPPPAPTSARGWQGDSPLPKTTPRATATISLPYLLPEPPSQRMEEIFLAPRPEFGWALMFGDRHPHFLPPTLGTGEPPKFWRLHNPITAPRAPGQTPEWIIFPYQLFIQILELLRQAVSKCGSLKFQPNGRMLTKTEKICVKMIQLAFLPIHELRKQSPGFTSLIFTRLVWVFKALGQGLDPISLSSQRRHSLLAGNELGIAAHRAVCAGPRTLAQTQRVQGGVLCQWGCTPGSRGHRHGAAFVSESKARASAGMSLGVPSSLGNEGSAVWSHQRATTG